MEKKITQILDEMVSQDFRYTIVGLQSYVKSKLGFDVGLEENHLEHEGEIALNKLLDEKLALPQYRVLLDIKSLKGDIKINLSPKNKS